MNKFNLSYAAESNIGRSRNKNEDSFCLLKINEGQVLLSTVADGIGGHGFGEIASYICCHDLTSAAMKMNVTPTPENLKSFLDVTLKEINQTIFQRNFREKILRPMGCTIVSALFTQSFIVTTNAGDSRFYELTEDELYQHSIDHLVSTRLKFPAIGNSPALIYRAIGTRPQLELDINIIPRNPNSRYLLCSDGLYRLLPAKKIINILRQSTTPREATGNLIKAAILTGINDNITAICVFPGD